MFVSLHLLFTADLYRRRTGQRVTGMGLPTVAMGLLGLLMPPQAAAALLVLPSLLTNLWQLLAGPALAQIVRRLWLMMTGIIMGTLAGSSLLISLNPRCSALALGTVLIAYAGYALCGPALQVSARVEKWLSPLMGGLTGVSPGRPGYLLFRRCPGCRRWAFVADGAGPGPGIVVHPVHSGDGGRPLSARWLARRFAAAVGAGAGARAARHVAGTADPLASQPAALSSGLSVVPAGAGAGACPPGGAGGIILAAGNVFHIVFTGVLVDL